MLEINENLLESVLGNQSFPTPLPQNFSISAVIKGNSSCDENDDKIVERCQ